MNDEQDKAQGTQEKPNTEVGRGDGGRRWKQKKLSNCNKVSQSSESAEKDDHVDAV